MSNERKVFVKKVIAEDGLPKKEGVYFTSNGLNSFLVNLNMFNINRDSRERDVEWYLEEIPISELQEVKELKEKCSILEAATNLLEKEKSELKQTRVELPNDEKINNWVYSIYNETESFPTAVQGIKWFESQIKFKGSDAVEFAEWSNRNCVRLSDGKWQYSSNTSGRYTSDELYQLFLKQKNK